MSEEILNALIQLFAIIAKQDEGVDEKEELYVKNFLTQQLGDEAVEEYFSRFQKKAGISERKTEPEEESEDLLKKKKPKLTSVRDSVRILGLCKKINKTLNQKQKVVVLVRLFELVNTSRKFTDQRMAIINTVAEVFNIAKDEFKNIETFVKENELENVDNDSTLIITDSEFVAREGKIIHIDSLDGNILILRIKSSELYFLRYTGTQDVFLNGLGVYNNRIYLFANGSTIKLPKGKPIYYSDVVANFLADKSRTRLSFDVKDVMFKFHSGQIGLQNINFSETHGKLVGIMGASGAGKTTLLNLLSGIHAPNKGSVVINGIDLHKQHDEIEGVIGYIPQDDLLIEELTVYENLYYNAKLCFKDKSEAEMSELVEKTLESLGLLERKDLKVGNIFNKKISGGQRKRLNIALELIREPSILFVDEPTSGLSSRDSENVMDLLSELTLKGKLIFVVIHQPSSDIYKMFDKMIILDTGGYMVYYGNPVEAIVYFKTIDGQINSDVGECPTCGNVTPELVFNILEAKVVDEFGQYTPNRKISPQKWEEYYYSNIKIERVDDVKDDPPKNLNIPNWLKQFRIYVKRDLLSKISNTQYIVLNLTESPLLGFILSYIIRYIADPNSSDYILYDNENIPPYIFMSIVVALFLGLTVSAEEIFKDRKILKREKFLNLSRSSYLMSKITILIFISAIQAILFVLVGNTILGIWNMYFEFWIVLFSCFVFANLVGLNISATFNSAVTIYILIPFILIPLMSLGGAMFSFDKLNRKIGSVDKVPVIAEFMVSRWAYEALMVYQFKNNEFERDYFEIDMRQSIADFKQVHYIPALKDNLEESYFAYEYLEDPDFDRDSLLEVMELGLATVKYEISNELRITPEVEFDYIDQVNINDFNDEVYEEVLGYLTDLEDYYSRMFFQADSEKEAIKNYLNEVAPGEYIEKRNRYHNEHLEDIVTKTYEKYKILQYGYQLVQNVDPIFMKPDDKSFIGFRAHFYAPKKYFMGQYLDTFWFDILVIWVMTILLYIPLYFEHLKKIIDMFGKINIGKVVDNINLKNLFSKKKAKAQVTPDKKKDIKETETTVNDLKEE